MKLLVTGGAGYIGSSVAHQLCDAGNDVVILDNLYSGHRWAIPQTAQFVEGDVGNAALLEKLFREHAFDAVLHFAAHIEVGESVENPLKYYKNNTVAALTLFENVRKFSIPKVIFSSTAAVYGEPTSDAPLSEDAPLKPVNPYGASKVMAERVLSDLAAASGGGLNYVILRYFNAAGARRDLKVGQSTPRATHLVKIAAEVALGIRDGLTIFGTDYATKDGTCLRDYVHIEDLAHAHMDALSYLDKGGRSDVFNVGYGHASSVYEVIESMKRVTSREIRVVKGSRRGGDSTALTADNSKIKKALAWVPRFDDLDLICKTAFDWEKTLAERKR
jgi:UDP-glucose 4-epimerase